MQEEGGTETPLEGPCRGVSNYNATEQKILKKEKELEILF
jgi:hypothetical protein